MSVRRALRRAGWSVLVLLVSAVGTFALLRLVPADPARVIAGPKADAATIAAIRADLELDRPTLVQLGHHLGRLVRGDLGRSYRTGRPVLREIVDRLPASGALALAAIAIGVGVGLALAVLTSRRAGRSPSPRSPSASASVSRWPC